MFSATLIQSVWRGWNIRRRWPLIKQNLMALNVGRNNSVQNQILAKPRPVPITGTPPPFTTTQQQIQTKTLEIVEQNLIQETCTLFGIDLVIN